MKQFAILVVTVGAAYAGVLQLSDSDQQQKLQEFARLCESGQVPETGADVNGVQVYCKTSPAKVIRTVRHSKEVAFGGGKNQAIFVRPATWEQTHEIEVRGRLEGHKKQVYVVPGTVQNKYRIKVIPGPPKPEKPTIFYLQNGNSKRTDDGTFPQIGAFNEEIGGYQEESVSYSGPNTSDSLKEANTGNRNEDDSEGVFDRVRRRISKHV